MRVDLAGGPVDVERLAGADDRAPLVFLHEGLGCISLWRDWPARLAAASGRAAVVWSRHGYGRSAPARLPRPATYLHDEALGPVAELLDHLEVERPVLVGHSDGASIALVHAACARRPVAGLVLLAPHVVVEERTVTSIADARERWPDGTLRAGLARHHDDPDATFRGWNDVWLSDAFAPFDLTDLLGRVEAPVLAVQCRDDPYGTLEQLRLIRLGVAGPYEELVLDAADHAPQRAAPDIVSRAVLAWLAERP